MATVPGRGNGTKQNVKKLDGHLSCVEKSDSAGGGGEGTKQIMETRFFRYWLSGFVLTKCLVPDSVPRKLCRDLSILQHEALWCRK